MGISEKKSKGTVLKMRLGGTSFLMSGLLLPQDPVWHAGLCHDKLVAVLWMFFPSQTSLTWSVLLCFTGVEAGHPVWSVWDSDNHPGCHLPKYQEKSRLADREDARPRLHRFCSGTTGSDRQHWLHIIHLHSNGPILCYSMETWTRRSVMSLCGSLGLAPAECWSLLTFW